MGDRKRMTGRPVVRAEAEEEIEGVGDSCKQLWGSKAHRELPEQGLMWKGTWGSDLTGSSLCLIPSVTENLSFEQGSR